jgi:hypothetical protein
MVINYKRGINIEENKGEKELSAAMKFCSTILNTNLLNRRKCVAYFMSSFAVGTAIYGLGILFKMQIPWAIGFSSVGMLAWFMVLRQLVRVTTTRNVLETKASDINEERSGRRSALFNENFVDQAVEIQNQIHRLNLELLKARNETTAADFVENGEYHPLTYGVGSADCLSNNPRLMPLMLRAADASVAPSHDGDDWL